MIFTKLELKKIESRLDYIESRLTILDSSNSFENLEIEALNLELEDLAEALKISMKNALRREKIEKSGLRLVK